MSDRGGIAPVFLHLFDLSIGIYLLVTILILGIFFLNRIFVVAHIIDIVLDFIEQFDRLYFELGISHQVHICLRWLLLVRKLFVRDLN